MIIGTAMPFFWDGSQHYLSLDAYSYSQYARTAQCETEYTCWFCGGLHMHLWRDSSIHKLKKMWSTVPYQDSDCIITDHAGKALHSYCVQIGVGDLVGIESERSDVSQAA